MSNNNSKKPLVVDLDGTLIKTDLLVESFLLLIRVNPLMIFWVLVWILRGKTTLKEEIAKRVDVPVEHLPYNFDLIEYLKSEKSQGRTIILATASHERYAHDIANYLELFSDVIATNRQVNLSGTKKRQALIQQYGEGGYVYAGNAPVDLKVWSHAAAAVVVGNDRIVKAAETACAIEKSFIRKPPSIKVFIKALRVHQWVKNGLIFIPLITAHQLQNVEMLMMSLLGFLAFSVCASSVYFLNDLLDLFDDRRHATKCKRPFAAGSLSLLVGIIGTPILLIIAIVACLFLPIEFQVVLAVYYILTLAYSFKLKRLVMVDVVTLASLYTIRIVAGAAAIGVLLSFWLLSFSIFVFLSLAIIKRYTELMKLKAKSASKALGRGYQVEDLELLSSLGGASGYISVLVLALYINSPDVKSMYANPVMMWPACLVMLYWISRIWIIAHRGNMDDDPIVFALKDKASLLCGMLIAGFMFLAV